MSLSSDQLRRSRCHVLAVVVVATTAVTWPTAAFSLTPGTTAPVVPIQTPVVTYAGGTAELDGSTTLEPTRTGTKSRIDCTILFAKDSDQLRPGAGDKLNRLAQQLQRQGKGRVQVTGYTDDLGSSAHGLDLSRRRAQKVAAALSDTLPSKTYPMSVQGLGEANPAVPNTSESNRRKNRRVTVILTVTAPHPTQAEAQTPPPTKPTTVPTATVTPTVQPSPPAPRPSNQTTPFQPSADTTDTPSPGALKTRPNPWPTTAGVGVALILLGALADQVRRQRRPGQLQPSSTGTDTQPPTARNATNTATTNVQDSDSSVARTSLPAGGKTSADELSEPARSQLAHASAGVGPTTADTRPARVVELKSARLDHELEAWFSNRTGQPRLTLLGPVHARAHGQALARRRPYYTELLAYLTLKPHGATVDEVADAFSITTARVRTDMKVLRDWLGVDATTHEPYLPDARTSPAALQRGLPTYQVRDILCDYHLFNQLQSRANRPGNGERIADLETALRLVTGSPFTHTRAGGWHWIAEGHRLDLQVTNAIVTVAQAATHHAPHLDSDPAYQPALAVAAAHTAS